MNEKSTIGERLSEVINHYGMNINSFSKALGLTGNTVIGRIVNDPDRSPSFAVLQRIVTKYPALNCYWLLTGEGSMMDDSGKIHHEYVYYFRLESTSDIINALSGSIKPTAIMHMYGFKESQYAFDVVGDSMSPRFNPGEIIICRDINHGNIITGNAYLIVGEDFQLTRYIRSVDDKSIMKLGAENPKYPDMNMPMHRVEHLLAITGTITKETY